jgi:putative phosphoribosyl transferase
MSGFRTERTGGYRDRAEAGRALARRLGHLGSEHPVVLALPRGGVPVAAEIARALRAPLDIISVRKIGAPSQPELAVGAVIEGPAPRVELDRRAMDRLGLRDEDVAPIIARECEEARRRLRAYHGGRKTTPIAGRTVIVVDDGVATGWSVIVALHAVRGLGPRRLVLAVPVAPSESLPALHAAADEVVCPLAPEGFTAVGEFYRDFRQVEDAEVTRLLDEASASPIDRHQSPAGDRVGR